MSQRLVVLEYGDDIVHRGGAGQQSGGPVDHPGQSAPPLVHLAPEGGLGQFLFGGPYDADDPAGPPRLVPDVRLGAGPVQRSVAVPDPEVRAVGGQSLLERPRDQALQPRRLVVRHQIEKGLRIAVELLGAQAEDLEGGPVEMHQPAVEIPVEAAHTVQRQAQIRMGGPVVRQRYGSRRSTPISHAATISPIGRAHAPGTS